MIFQLFRNGPQPGARTQLSVSTHSLSPYGLLTRHDERLPALTHLIALISRPIGSIDSHPTQAFNARDQAPAARQE